MDVERFRRPALATALAILGDHHLAEDAVQDALIEAMRAWDTLREPEKRAAWIRTIVRRRCYRLLRRRDVGGPPLPASVGRDEPAVIAVEQQEASRRLLTQVRALPRALRDVVALHYLSGCSHRETAAFLDLPVTTVNNRLHLARKILRRSSTMQPTSFAGTVIDTDLPFVDLRFSPEGVPDVFDALAPAQSPPTLRVVQQRGDGVVRCALLGEGQPQLGQHYLNSTADGGTYTSVVATPEHLGTLVQGLGLERKGLFETGIKPIDLFCPLPETGTIATLGTSGTGKMVLTLELLQRMGSNGPQLVCLADRAEPALIRDLRDEADDFDRRALWVVSSVANDPQFASEGGVFDAVAYTTPLMGVRGLWPAVDPLRSRSSVEVRDRHATIAQAARDLIRQGRERTLDPVLLELLAVGAYGAARRRAQAAPDTDDPVVHRARRLEAFLTHPFDVGREITGKDGETVCLDDTLAGTEAILAGACDHTPVEDLMYVGALPR